MFSTYPSGDCDTKEMHAVLSVLHDNGTALSTLSLEFLHTSMDTQRQFFVLMSSLMSYRHPTSISVLTHPHPIISHPVPSKPIQTNSNPSIHKIPCHTIPSNPVYSYLILSQPLPSDLLPLHSQSYSHRKRVVTSNHLAHLR